MLLSSILRASYSTYLDLHPRLPDSQNEMSGLVGYGSSDEEDEGVQSALPAALKVFSLCTLLE